MDSMEEKLGSILNDPNMMQQIMALAQNLSKTSEPPKPQESPRQPPPGGAMPEIDLGMLQTISGIASQSGIDQEQQTLLKALHPYLSQGRLHKLEKAMRATKMARLATSLMGQGGFSFLTGR